MTLGEGRTGQPQPRPISSAGLFVSRHYIRHAVAPPLPLDREAKLPTTN